jgi:hypothetical protein
MRRQRLEHPTIVRLSHWMIAIAVAILIPSGLEIFAAFPSFGDKTPEHVLFMAGGGAWRFPSDQDLALHRDVRAARVHCRPRRDGRAPRVEQLRLDVDRREIREWINE